MLVQLRSTYAKNVKEKETKCSLKTTEVPLNADGHVLTTTFDIYQGTIAPNCFKSHTNSWCFDFCQKKFCLMCDLKFYLSKHRFYRTICPGLKKITFRPNSKLLHFFKQEYHNENCFFRTLMQLFFTQVYQYVLLTQLRPQYCLSYFFLSRRGAFRNLWNI